jgi:hypothetical protein
MGKPIKSPQLRRSLLCFTSVEILGEIFCGSVYNYCAGNLITWGTNQPGRTHVASLHSDSYPKP